MRRDVNLPLEPNGREAFLSACGSVVVRVALLFSTAGLAFALFLAPMMLRNDRDGFGRADIDTTVTGSIGTAGNYTVRQSVLSEKPGAVCIIRDDGRRSGDC